MSKTSNNSVQEKLTQLSSLVEWFQSDDFTLEAAVEKFKTAEQLADEVEKDLLAIKNEITVVKQRFDKEV